MEVVVMKFRKVVRKRALVVILMITMICQGIVPAYADTLDKHSESENVASGVISEEDSPVADEIVLASPDNAAYDSGKNEDVSIEEVFEEDPLSADGLILGTPINEEDDRLIIGSEGTVLRVPDNPKDIELVYSLEDDTYIGSTYSSEIDQEYADKSVFVQLTLTPLDPQQIAFGSREQKVKIPLSDMLVLDDRIYFSIEASNEMKLTNSEVKDNWEVELSLLISDDENTELEDLTDGEMFHREGSAQSGDDAFAFADSVLFTVENIKQTSFDPYSLLVVMAPQDTWWKSENYQRSDIDEIIFGQTPTADIKETWNADADNYGFIKCFITETIGDDRSYRTVYIARTVGNSSRIMANPDSESMFNSFSGDSFSHLTKIDINDLDTSNVTNMQSMFDECEGLEELDLSGFDTGSVTNMSCMFRGCNSLEELDLSGFDTSSVTYMGNLISGCSSLKEIDLSSFNTGNTIIMEGMFEGCEKLTELDLSRFKTDNVTSMFDMFKGCERLTTIFAYEFDTDNVPSIYNYDSEMFAGCISLTGEKGTKYDANHVGKEYAHIDGGADAPGYFTSKKSEPEESLKYTVTFDSNGHGTAPAQQQIAEGEKIEKPDDLVSEGYTFEGWYKESSCENRWDFDTEIVSKDITLFAKWTNSTEIASGISGTCRWSVDGDTLIIQALDKQDGTLDLWTDTPPWYDYRTEISDVRLLGNIHAKTCRRMFAEFNSAYIRSNTILDLSNLDTSEVTDMSGMFYACNCKGLNLEGIDTSNVINMSAMFYDFKEELDLSSFDTRNVTDMSGMFMGGYKDPGFSATVSLNLSSFNTEKVTDMSLMFYDTYFDLSGLNLGNFDTENVIDMGGMFCDCDSLTTLNLNNFDTSNVKTMGSMFSGCSSLTTLDVSSFDTKKVTDMNYMFSGCSSLAELNLKNFDTSSVGSMSGMFCGCSALTIIDLSSFDADSVYDTEWMFANCTNLKNVDLSNFAENKIKSTRCMFKDCSSLTNVNFGSFETSNIENMTEMFSGCSSLTELDISSFSYRALIDKSYMFYGCADLKTIIVDKFCHDSGYSSSMFGGCTKLVGGKGTTYDENHINGEYAHIDGGQSNPGYFTSIDTDIENDSLKIKRFITPAMSYDIYLEAGMKCFEFNYDNTLFDRCETPIEVEVSDGASWDLYSDKECLDKLDKNKPVSLTSETNVFYIKVYDDTDSITYKIIITRILSNSITSTPVSYWSSFAYDSNKHITFDIQWGWDLFKNPLDHNCDRRTMIAALMLANGAYNDIELVYRDLGFNHICPNRRDREMDMAQYSFAGREVNFNGNKKLIIALTFRGTDSGWDWAWNAIAATAPDVGFETGAASAVADMLDYFEHNLNQYDKEDMIFFVTGHSLGGAEANEAAMLLAKEYNPENIFAYTFNSPTTTDKSDYSVPKLFNLYNTEDVVPKAGEHYGIIQNITNGQWLGKRYGHDMPFTRGAFMEDEFRLITGGRGFNDVAPLYQSDYSTSFFESMGIALSNIFNSAAYNVNKIKLEHQPDTLLAYLLSSESITVKPSQPGAWRRISVKCPVDIEVIDSNGVTVAKIEDNQIKELRDSSLTLFVCGDEKYILSSEKKDYKLKLTGTDNGEMELAVDEIDFSTGEAATSKQFDHVVLYKGKEMLGSVNEVAEESVLQLAENGRPIKNIETNGTETPISTIYTVSFNSNGHGTAPDSQQISAGGKVSKPADLTASGYTFGGWYKESSCINQWNFGTDIVSSSMTLYAKWTSNGSSYSGNYSSGSSGGGGSISKAKTTTGATYSPNWFVDASGVWKIRNSKGEIVKNAWLCDDVITANGKNVWYLLQADGSMLSAGLVQDNTGNFYSLETNHNGYFGMMRYKDGYYDCNGQQVYLKFNQKHDNSFGAVINEDGLEKLKQIYGITKYPIGNETCTYTASF